MKIKTSLFAVLLVLGFLGASSVLAATPKDFTRVRLLVNAGTDMELKNRLSSSISRHLRALGDVTISDSEPQFEIGVMATTYRMEQGGEAFIISVRLSQEPCRIIEEWLSNGAMKLLEDECTYLVTTFDAKTLEPLRREKEPARGSSLSSARSAAGAAVGLRTEPLETLRPLDRKLKVEPPKLEPMAKLKQLDGESDPGVDIAIVITISAGLRTDPYPESKIISELPRGARLALVERISTGPWFNVIHIASGVEGWVHESTIKITHTNHKQAAPVFQARRVADKGNPSVVARNDSYKALSLRVGTVSYNIPANSERSFTIEAGLFKYHASAPGVLPAFGEQSFQIGYTYTWRFWIETVVR